MNQSYAWLIFRCSTSDRVSQSLIISYFYLFLHMIWHISSALLNCWPLFSTTCALVVVTFFKMTQQPQQISLLLRLHALEDLISTWPLGDVLWQVVDITSTELHEPVAMIDQGLMTLLIFFCQIKLLCLQIFLVTYMICGWKCLVDKDRYWETENSCYRNPVLLQRSYWKISYYGQQSKYSWDQLNRLGKSVIEGTNKSIYS